jgi:cell division protein FtsW
MNKPKIKMGDADFILFATIMFLLAIGIVMVYSASSWVSGIKLNDDMFYLKKQLLWGTIGIIALCVTMSYDYHRLKSLTGILMIVCIPLMLLVFAFPAVNGAKRWIQLGFASIQPSEITKYVVVLYMAKSMDYKGERIKTFLEGILPYLLVSGFYAGLVLLQRNLSIASVIMIVTLIVLFVAGAKLSQLFGIVTPVTFAAGVIMIFAEPYRRARLFNFLDPWKDASGDGYQLIQSLLALGSGGIWGLSLGQSRQKCYYMPEPHNDFIFAIIGEELGLIGCAFIIILFLIFVWRGIRTAINAKDTYGTLLATGITSIVAIQAIINIAVVTGSMPVTGVPLPLISYGGSSLVINMAAMGILLNISRQTIKNKL